MARKKIVEATVCDTIRSVPVDMNQAKIMARETKRRMPRAKVKVRNA